MRKLVFSGIIASGVLGYALGLWGAALYEDGWPFAVCPW